MLGRSLDVTLVSTKGLKLKKKETIYAVTYIRASHSDYVKKFKSPVSHETDSTWNFPLKLGMPEIDLQENCVKLVVKIKAKRLFEDKKLGEIHVPLKALLFLEYAMVKEKPMQSVSFPLSGKYEGVVNLTYKFGEFYLLKPEPVVTRAPSGRQPSGRQSTSSSSGVGTGLIGGMMVADIDSHDAGGGDGGRSGGC